MKKSPAPNLSTADFEEAWFRGNRKEKSAGRPLLYAFLLVVSSLFVFGVLTYNRPRSALSLASMGQGGHTGLPYLLKNC